MVRPNQSMIHALGPISMAARSPYLASRIGSPSSRLAKNVEMTELGGAKLIHPRKDKLAD
jgi:hypothetical protein